MTRRDVCASVATAVVVGADAGEVRRAVGATAWCVLEAVVAASHDGIAGVSIRSLAAELAVSKNTAQRAMAALRTAGLVEPVGSRRADGRFAAGAYRVTVPASVLAPVDVPAAAPSPRPLVDDGRPARRSRRRDRPVVVEQLSLLEV